MGVFSINGVNAIMKIPAVSYNKNSKNCNLQSDHAVKSSPICNRFTKNKHCNLHKGRIVNHLQCIDGPVLSCSRYTNDKKCTSKNDLRAQEI